MHDQDFAALLETPDVLRQALDVGNYVSAFCDEVPRRFLGLLAQAMREVEDDLPGWQLSEEREDEHVYFEAGSRLKRLAAMEISVAIGLDDPNYCDDITFIGPYWAVWARDNIQAGRRVRLKEAVARLIPGMRDNGGDVPAWGRPAGWPMSEEADEILAVTGEAGLALARTMAARAVALAQALEAAADGI